MCAIPRPNSVLEKQMNPLNLNTAQIPLDDDPFMLKLLRRQLAQLSYTQVDAFDSGQKPIEQINSSKTCGNSEREVVVRGVPPKVVDFLVRPRYRNTLVTKIDRALNFEVPVESNKWSERMLCPLSASASVAALRLAPRGELFRDKVS
jgi:hypothetical protein